MSTPQIPAAQYTIFANRTPEFTAPAAVSAIQCSSHWMHGMTPRKKWLVVPARSKSARSSRAGAEACATQITPRARLFQWNFVEVAADHIVRVNVGVHVERVLNGPLDHDRSLLGDRVFKRGEAIRGHVRRPGSRILRNGDDAAGVQSHSHQHVLSAPFPYHAAKSAAHHDRLAAVERLQHAVCGNIRIGYGEINVSPLPVRGAAVIFH